jgi:hydrogenase-4 membrane subunit HyfE
LSLIAFHKFLIAAAIVFCFGFAGWELRVYLDVGRGTSLALAIVFAVLGFGLILYLRRLRRILGYDRGPH